LSDLEKQKDSKECILEEERLSNAFHQRLALFFTFFKEGRKKRKKKVTRLEEGNFEHTVVVTWE
jgi:hypothetical protein